ncbi:MAG: HAD-IC family P-type ATPase [Nanoarchaeota archaeon]|nr:HAD-IC family P-type ATPase [Nanoarchaeota archaeon]MBU1849234.1 HAD-IC family P-type ATPase [Nanoarchaeota archaeon]
MDALIKLTPKKSFVIRNKEEKEISSKELTIGDIIVLRRGGVVGADAVLIESNSLKLDESTLTGESVSVNKFPGQLTGTVDLANRTNMVFSGTNITDGFGLAVVVHIGMQTEIGNISSMIKSIKDETTPLQKRIDKLTKQISIAVIFIAVAVFFIGVWKGSNPATMFIFSMAVIVSGIPESLPTVVAVTLAKGVKRMADKNAIVKRLPSVETLGTTTVICTDKTGTLTQNKMFAENIFTSDLELSITGKGYEPTGLFLKENVQIDPNKHETLSKLLEIGILCNNSDVKKKGTEWVMDGEPTEGALIVLGHKAGLIKSDLHKSMLRIKEHPFDSERKCMSTIHSHKDGNFVYSKGAPELLIQKAKYYLNNGKILKLDKSTENKFIKKNKEYASKGLRVLGLAFKKHEGSSELKNVESGLIFVGLVSIRDPPEPSAKKSIKLCKEAGIKVVMITGDNELTAKAIGSELGIYNDGDTILTGKQLQRMSDLDLEKIVNNVTVYARVTPAHKLRIVKTLQRAGHIVAMTGDGVNDAPALKSADIGIAMGVCGTEVAKESAELILKDDNFTTIVNAVEEGRTIYENIRKFISYLLVGNLSEILIVLIAVIVGLNLPLTALMILFINLVTSEFPALGLSFEKPSERIMKQNPRDPKEGILSNYIIFKIAQIAPLIILGTVILYQWELVFGAKDIFKAQTIAFATIIFFELFHTLNVRSWDESIFTKNFFSNKYLLGGVILSSLLTIIVIYWAPLQRIFGTVALNVQDWILILLVSLSVIGYVEIQKTLVQVELKEREKMEIHPTRHTVD